MHWNGGASYLENERDVEEGIILQNKLAILAVSEASLRQDMDNQLVEIQDYKMLEVKVRANAAIKMSQLVVYVKDNIKYDRQNELENDEDTMCYMDVKLEGGQKITFGFINREFQVWKEP